MLRSRQLACHGPGGRQVDFKIMVVFWGGAYCRLVPRCRAQPCLPGSAQPYLDPWTCRCSRGSDRCGPGQRLYPDIFGQGVCGCEAGLELVEEEGDCRPPPLRGPCSGNQTALGGSEGCTRVWDLIPSSGNTVASGGRDKEKSSFIHIID